MRQDGTIGGTKRESDLKSDTVPHKKQGKKENSCKIDSIFTTSRNNSNIQRKHE
jgi:hypothetical protein